MSYTTKGYKTGEMSIKGKVKEVDFEKELDKFFGMYRKDGKTYDIEDNEECVDWKTDCNPEFEMYFAKYFFELGLKVKADQGTTPLINHVPPKFGQGTLSRPAYKNGCFYHQNFISDKEFLDRAIDYIIEVDGTDNICEKLHDIPEEHIFCERDCQNLDHWCVLRFLRNYNKKED